MDNRTKTATQDAADTFGLSYKAVELILTLCDEAGDEIKGVMATCYDFTGNHLVADINAAAGGDVEALVKLRTACGLPIFR